MTSKGNNRDNFSMGGKTKKQNENVNGWPIGWTKFEKNEGPK